MNENSTVTTNRDGLRKSHAAGRPGACASIIIVNHNGRHYLGNCLQSIYETAASEFEIILVDNDSDDGSCQLVAEQFPGVRMIESPENLGFGGGSNLGALHAAGEYLAFLNPDTVVEAGWLEALISALDQDPRNGLATSKILLMNNKEQINTAGNDVHLTGLTLCRGIGQPSSEHDEQIEVAAVSGAAFAIRRDLYFALNGFDAGYFLYFEDTDLSLRARLAGWRCICVPDSIVYHDYELRVGSTKIYLEERNRYLTLLKVFRWRTLLILTPALVLAEIITWGYVISKKMKDKKGKLRAYAYVIRHWSLIMASRRQVQATRRVGDREMLALASHRLNFEQTADDLLAKPANMLSDPIFYLQQRLAMAAARW